MKFLSKLSNQDIVADELKVCLYKDLLKCCYGENVNSIIFVETLCEILSKIANTTSDYFKNLNIIDVFCFLLDTRINSQGNECNLILLEDDRKSTINLNLNHLRNEIAEMQNSLKTKITFGFLTITFECPSLRRLLGVSDIEYTSFIKAVEINQNGNTLTKEVSSNEEAIEILDKLSPKLLIEVVTNFTQFAEKVTNINFLSRYGIKNGNLTFIPSIESLIWFTKIMFNENLETLYTNIFNLACISKIDSNYIENCAVGEYLYFVSCLQKELSNQMQANQSIPIQN